MAGHADRGIGRPVHKFVGDEIVAMFIPAMSGNEHASDAVRAARQLVAGATLRGLPAGAGVNTGTAFVGAVGEGSYTEFTAMGDPVNVAARLAAAAAAGEVLVTLGSAQKAHLALPDLEHRQLELKGKSALVEVVAIPAEAASA